MKAVMPRAEQWGANQAIGQFGQGLGVMNYSSPTFTSNASASPSIVYNAASLQ